MILQCWIASSSKQKEGQEILERERDRDSNCDCDVMGMYGYVWLYMGMYGYVIFFIKVGPIVKYSDVYCCY